MLATETVIMYDVCLQNALDVQCHVHVHVHVHVRVRVRVRVPGKLCTGILLEEVQTT